MTKKDYIIIAEALNRACKTFRQSTNALALEWLFAHDYTVKQLILSLQADNPKFDKVKFYEAVNKI